MNKIRKTRMTTTNQRFGTRFASILTARGTGTRFVVITDKPWKPGDRGEKIPLSLAALDQSFHGILVRCADCKAVVKLGDTEGERCVCASCWDSALDETEAMDRAQA